MSTDERHYLPDTSKITHQTVSNLAIEYQGSGLPEYVADVLHALPEGLQDPLRYTFSNHVTKERPLSLLHAADELGVSRTKSLGAAACIDVLWNVGIMIDDVYDNDATNARQEESAWSKFSKPTVLAASTAAVAAAVTYTARNYGIKDAYILSAQLREGVASLTQSRRIELDSPLEAYYKNYDMRSRFYTAAPMSTIAKHSDASPKQIADVQHSLQSMNRAGQMINDLQDFDMSDKRSRTHAFSDMRNGVNSVPIRHLWLASTPSVQQQLLAIHGKPTLTESDETFINRHVVETDMAPAVLSLITTEYGAARKEYLQALQPTASTIRWLDSWIEYKQDQANSVVTSLGNQALHYL